MDKLKEDTQIKRIETYLQRTEECRRTGSERYSQDRHRKTVKEMTDKGKSEIETFLSRPWDMVEIYVDRPTVEIDLERKMVRCNTAMQCG